MSSTFGTALPITIFGESHGPAIGVTIQNLPSGLAIQEEELHRFLQRRAPGRNALSTARKENDLPEFLSGVYRGRTTGAPLTAVIRNENTRSADYAAQEEIPRPGHADWTAHTRYSGCEDPRGGGHFSGRLTAPLCIAGGILRQILEQEGVSIGAHIARIGDCQDRPFPNTALDRQTLLAPAEKEFPVLDEKAGSQMHLLIEKAKAQGDSVGGIVECAVTGLPRGCGNPMFQRTENILAQILFGIPAVRGVEFGDGFACAAAKGSEFNDAILPDGTTRTNHAGGVLGGITTGMPLVFRTAIKPTPSIFLPQDSISLATGQAARLVIQGRHDPCIVPRAVPVVEAAAACAVMELLMQHASIAEWRSTRK